jgi:23S rRNA (cytosine1962-C5)-methyltransferase
MRPPRILDCDPIPGDEPRTIFKDENLWVVDKPAGWLTHRDGHGARPCVTDWCEEPVGIHQRLDVDTTGILLMSRSKSGAQYLQEAFESRRVKKTYLAVVEKWSRSEQGIIDRAMPAPRRQAAETRFQVLKRGVHGTVMELQPVTGRTHQLRYHLAEMGHPIRGDARYGDALDRRAWRTLLHCTQIALPDGRAWISPAPADFGLPLEFGPHALRADLRADTQTTCYREYHGEGDGTPGLYVDRYADWLWVQQDTEALGHPLPESKGIYTTFGQQDRSHGGQKKPILTSGVAAPESLAVLEHGVQYRVQLADQLSTGLFLDQRPQRTWLAQNGAGLRVLNTFAHAGGFSIAAATAGAETVSIDLSRNWIERIPFQLADNQITTEKHDWIYGDVFQWMPKLAKRGERFDLVILDPPSTSVGTKKKRWSARTDYPALVKLAVSLLNPGGRLWTATNHRGISPHQLARLVQKGAPNATLERVCPPAMDFPCLGPANQKTFVWRWPGAQT